MKFEKFVDRRVTAEELTRQRDMGIAFTLRTMSKDSVASARVRGASAVTLTEHAGNEEVGTSHFVNSGSLASPMSVLGNLRSWIDL